MTTPLGDPPVLFPWQGGKTRLVSWIVPKLPPHRLYIEPFAGTAAVLLAKPRAPIEVLNDRNGDLMAVYRCLQSPDLTRRLRRRLFYTPIARAAWERAREPVADPDDVLERAVRFLVRQIQSFGGKPDGMTWGGGIGDNIGRRQAVALRRLHQAARRLRGVALESADWRDLIARYDRPDTCWFFDPPYLTDRMDDVYGTGFTAADHAELVATVLRLRGFVVLCGYDHPIYAPLTDAGWTVDRRQVTVSVVGRTIRTGLAGRHLPPQLYRTECLWQSPRTVARQRRQRTVFDLLETAVPEVSPHDPIPS